LRDSFRSQHCEPEFLSMSRRPTDTKRRLLDAACELIARKGYRATTHQEICDQAKANIAAINYYFGSKENLYEAVWERAHELSQEAHGGFEAEEMGPMERLAAYVKARVECVLDGGPGGWFPRIVFWSHAELRPDCESLREKYLHPKRRYLQQVVQEVLGAEDADMRVHVGVHSVLSQHVFLNVTRMRHGGTPLHRKDLGPEEKDAVVRRMQEFVLGGVVRLRDEMRKGETR